VSGHRDIDPFITVPRSRLAGSVERFLRGIELVQDDILIGGMQGEASTRLSCTHSFSMKVEWTEASRPTL
jgi:hypothetical protein